jgi:voltage-gated potassium channel
MEPNNEQKRLGILDILVLILSVYVLGTLIVDTLFTLPKEISRVLGFLDNLICVFFIIEFFIRLTRAENKLKFMKWGWIDLLSSIPNIDFLRAGRALRLIRILRILRAFRSTKNIVTHIFKNKAQGALLL